MLLNDMNDRQRLAYVLSLSTKRYVVEHPRPGLRFIGMAIFIGLILAIAYLAIGYLWQ